MKYILAFDCGGTATRAGLYDERGKLLAEKAGGPSNPAEGSAESTAALIADLGRSLLQGKGPLLCIAVGVAGANDSMVRDRIATEILRRLEAAHVVVSDDRWPILLANAGDGGGVVAVAGTGSGVLARSRDGQSVHLGGRGSLMGDEGGAYHVAVRALRASSRAADGLGASTVLATGFLEATGCRDLAELARWLQGAAKPRIAHLARIVTECAERGDETARACIEAEASLLAEKAVEAHQRLGLSESTPVLMSGGLFEGSPVYTEAFRNALEHAQPPLECMPAPRTHHDAAFALASVRSSSEYISLREAGDESSPSLPATEAKGESARNLDELSALQIVRAMSREDARAVDAAGREAEAIARVIEKIAEAFRKGGRLVYVGAGTSGRLGVMDAVECVPTFGVPPDRVIGVIAGGEAALRQSIEGAEDDKNRAVKDLDDIDPPLDGGDVVVGVSASGTTPYVKAALEEASLRGADTFLLCCNPACRDAAGRVIALDTGPEVLPGSTRLKAGTAIKTVLNMFSTGGMSLSGHVYEGWMVGLRPVNEKLRVRAAGIITALTGKDAAQAKELLERAGYRVGVALLMERRRLTAKEAEAVLDRAGGSLRAALEEGAGE